MSFKAHISHLAVCFSLNLWIIQWSFEAAVKTQKRCLNVLVVIICDINIITIRALILIKITCPSHWNVSWQTEGVFSMTFPHLARSQISLSLVRLPRTTRENLSCLENITSILLHTQRQVQLRWRTKSVEYKKPDESLLGSMMIMDSSLQSKALSQGFSFRSFKSRVAFVASCLSSRGR